MDLKSIVVDFIFLYFRGFILRYRSFFPFFEDKTLGQKKEKAPYLTKQKKLKRKEVTQCVR
jgi:hypothetical protein